MKAWKTAAVGLVAAIGSTVSATTSAEVLHDRMLWSDPAARAYLSLGFGASADAVDAPVSVGLRVDRDARSDWTRVPALARVDFDSAGLTEATLNGMPLVSRDPVVYQQDGDIVYNWTDWGLFALGLGGIGYLIYEVADSEDDPDPQPVDGGNGDDGDDGDGGGGGGGLLGGLLGGKR